jgi:L-lactate dehydrogenase complex protein LldF
VRLDIPRMLLALRNEGQSSQPVFMKAAMRMFAWTATKPRLYRSSMRVVRRFLSGRSRGGWIGRLPGMAAGWTSSRDLRAPAARSFQDQWRDRRRQESVGR